MIPKTIHYCWFSGERKPKNIMRCIESWKRVLPDYTVKCWDGDSFDFNSLPFTKEAMELKQYAAAADYVRLYALYTEGGIYLDSDVLVFRPFDNFLDDLFFSGTETYLVNKKRNYRIEAAIIGSEKGHPFVKECMNYYETNHFIRSDGTRDNQHIVMPTVMSNIAEQYGYEYKNHVQILNNIIKIYPTSVFNNTLSKDYINPLELYALHQNAGSWIDYSDRGWLFQFCHKHGMMNLYHKIEKTI